MVKKNIMIFSWIFGLLIFFAIVSVFVCHFIEKSNLLFIALIIILLVILESVCIICLTSLSNEEKLKKFELLERVSFFENKIGEKELIKMDKKEIYKIFCNTLVDL